MDTIKHKTIILFSFGILTISIIALNGCSAVGTRNHHEQGLDLSTILKQGDSVFIETYKSEGVFHELGKLVSEETLSNLKKNVKGIKFFSASPSADINQKSINENILSDNLKDETLNHKSKNSLVLTGSVKSSISDETLSATASNRIIDGVVNVRLIDRSSSKLIWQKEIANNYRTILGHSKNSGISSRYYTDEQLAQNLSKILGTEIARYVYFSSSKGESNE